MKKNNSHLLKEINEEDLFSAGERILKNYMGAIKRNRGTVPFISVLIPIVEEYEFEIRNTIVESYKKTFFVQPLVTVHYSPSEPTYYWRRGLDLEEAVWRAELNGWENYGHHKHSQWELPEYKLLHPKTPARKKIKIEDLINDRKFEEEDIPEFIEIVKNLNQNALSVEGIKSVKNFVSVTFQRKLYYDTLGSEIYQENLYWYLYTITAAPCEDLPERVFSLSITHGAFGGLKTLKSLEEELLNSHIDTAKESVIFSKARSDYKGFSLASGKFRAVLDGKVAGTAIHEYLGHLVEAQRLLDSHEALIFDKKLGEKIAREEITIIDDSRIEIDGIKPISYYVFDEEGVEKQCTEIIKNGIFNSYLHSKLTAGTLSLEKGGGILTGNARVGIEKSEGNEEIKTIPRMSTLYIKPGDYKFEELLEEAKGGLYISSGAPSGEVDTELATGIVYVDKIYYIDRNLDLIPLRLPNASFSLTGDALTFLSSIEKIGDKSTLSLDSGYCGDESGFVPQAIFSPSLLVREVDLKVTTSAKPRKKPLTER
jgi:predicted Zn-dependent protease